MGKKQLSIIISIVVIGALSSIWFGWFATGFGVGVVGLWFGLELFKVADLNVKIVSLLMIEILIIWFAFSLAYYEINSDFYEAMIISIESLFHFSLISIPDNMMKSSVLRVLVCLESLIGYLIVVSGVVLLLKKRNMNNDHNNILT